MNEFEAHEHHAAAQLQVQAATLVSTYAHPSEAAAARIGVLQQALENELRDQENAYALKFFRRVRLLIDRQAKEAEAIYERHLLGLPVIDMAAPGAAAALVALSKEKQS